MCPSPESRSFAAPVPPLSVAPPESEGLAAVRHQVRDLQHALETARVIGIAIGILVERHQCTVNDGFDLLVREARARGIKVSDLAANLVFRGDAASGPDLRTAGPS